MKDNVTKMASVKAEENPVLKIVFHGMLDYHKLVLRLAILNMKKGSDEYRIFRSETFDSLWRQFGEIAEEMVSQGKAEKCPCGSDMRRGRSPCSSCGSSGYRMVD